MEADLLRFYAVDYRDRWRRDPAGRRLLTFRRLGVLVRHLPPESAVAHINRNQEPYWTVEAHLLDEVRMALVGSKKKPARPHPQRPTGKKAAKDNPERRKKLASAKRRADERRARIASGEIT